LCKTVSYPYHEGEPSELRTNIDDNLANVTLSDVVDHITKFLDTLDDNKPILIGHSMGGLLVQILVAQKRASIGVCISPAPPKGILSFKFSFLKANLGTVNPLKGDSVCLPSVEWFHYAFCNTMTIDETRAVYDALVVPESRNIPRSSTKDDGFVDTKQPHVPLLFIAGEKDTIIPMSLVEKEFKSYTDKGSVKELKTFANKTHFICGQKDWEEVADFILSWLSNK